MLAKSVSKRVLAGKFAVSDSLLVSATALHSDFSTLVPCSATFSVVSLMGPFRAAISSFVERPRLPSCQFTVALPESIRADSVAAKAVAISSRVRLPLVLREAVSPLPSKVAVAASSPPYRFPVRSDTSIRPLSARKLICRLFTVWSPKRALLMSSTAWVSIRRKAARGRASSQPADVDPSPAAVAALGPASASSVLSKTLSCKTASTLGLSALA